MTYEIISGDRNLFEIDPKSGEIRTQKGLDYEIQRMHFLTISTEESRGIFNGKQTTCIGKKLCLRKKGPVCNVNFQFHENMKSFHLFFLQNNLILKKKMLKFRLILLYNGVKTVSNGSSISSNVYFIFF